jgi:hypothetical protein
MTLRVCQTLAPGHPDAQRRTSVAAGAAPRRTRPVELTARQDA